jgi:hypothetical protein
MPMSAGVDVKLDAVQSRSGLTAVWARVSEDMKHEYDLLFNNCQVGNVVLPNFTPSRCATSSASPPS